MNKNFKGELGQTIERMRSEELVFRADTPLLMVRHGRWLFVTLGLFFDGLVEYRGIRALNFMSKQRAHKTIADWLPFCRLEPFEAVSDIFRQEVESKILPEAADYRAWLETGGLKLVGGFTTDTLQVIEDDGPNKWGKQIARIQTMMDRGMAGPFLSFRRRSDFLEGGQPNE
ncbi:MAG: hypothetical protein QNJ45_05380 [Ardenticatenaceae bacterium]|nr:hypothetical protein [Ardenticatenaceae bacterium]